MSWRSETWVWWDLTIISGAKRGLRERQLRFRGVEEEEERERWGIEKIGGIWREMKLVAATGVMAHQNVLNSSLSLSLPTRQLMII